MANEIETTRVFMHPDGRMNRKNAALYIGCAPKTLADWATKGIGPTHVMVGGRVFYFRDDLDQWISSRKSVSSQRPEILST